MEYVTIVIDPDAVTIEELKERIADARRGGLPKPPKVRYTTPMESQPRKRTVDEVPEAKGNFSW